MMTSNTSRWPFRVTLQADIFPVEQEGYTPDRMYNRK
jgi:hypothetical protein